MEQQAANLITTLKRTAASSDTKLSQLNALKSDIKHYRVPEGAQATIFDALRLAISQTASSTIANSAFSTLGHLIKRLKIQDASGHTISQLAPRLLPALQDRLSDQREALRSSASHALTELWPFVGNDVERIVRDEAIAGSNPRAKEAGMHWVVKMHKEENMPFKSHVSPIVSCLESSDGTVREAAKATLVELFTNAPNGAKADLKKQLKAHSVRHSIETQLLEQIGGTTSSRPATGRAPAAEQEMDMGASTASLPNFDHVAHFKETILSEEAKPPPPETVPMDPVYIHSQRECDDAFSDMLPFFEGKETEGNWMNRDKSVLKLRRMTKGNAPNEYHRLFMAGIKSMVEGILKVANSLRTTMSTNGCQLVQELAKTLGPALDPHVEMFLQSFIKMSASTKHIASENGTNTADAIFQNVSYNNRLMQHVWSAAQDKNAQTRQSATIWLRSILRRQANYKSQFQSSGGLEHAEKCIKKGIDDANPKVKEGARASYWLFARGWPDRAEAIMNSLDPKSKNLLEKDPNNPNKSAASSQGSGTTTASKPPAGRSALKEMMAAQKKAKMQGRMPERPGSAMAALSPSKPKPSSNLNSSHNRAPSNLSQSSRGEARVPSAASTTSNGGGSTASGSTAKGGSLMSGPLRRPRRPEIKRPQTAEPYASQRLLRPETPANHSPVNSPPKGMGTGASKSSIPTPRSRTHTMDAAISPTASAPKQDPSAALSQDQQRPASHGSNGTHGEEQADDFTMVLPHRSNITTVRGHDHRPPMAQTMSVDSGLPTTAEEDGFTMVMPNLNTQPRSRGASPNAQRKPMKQLIEEARLRASDANTRPGSSQQRSRDPSHSPAIEMPPQRPSRRGSPVKAATPQPEVQIYEDPFTAEATSSQPTPRTEENRAVLSELPVNENVRVQSPTQSIGSSQSPASSPQRPSQSRSPAPIPSNSNTVTTNTDGAASTTSSTPQTPQDRAEALRNRRLLESGITRIRTRQLDAHGFRRVQELAKTQIPETWDGGRLFDELLSVLLEYLVQTFATPAPESKTSSLQTQALALVRALLVLQRKYASGWYAKALEATLSCRQHVESGSNSSSQLIDELQRTSDEILKTVATNPLAREACSTSVLDFLETETPLPAAPGQDAASAFALNTLHALVPAPPDSLPEPQLSRAIATAAKSLSSPSPDVRKAATEFAAELYALLVAGEAQEEEEQGKAVFWKGFQGVEEGRLALLTYYIARRGLA
ncbi:hypothetical protein MBLNU230_g5122t1 [Neophaeotheca triangularis]